MSETKVLPKVTVVAFEYILLNVFKLSFLLWSTQSHMAPILQIPKSESFCLTIQTKYGFWIVLKQKELFKHVQHTLECVSLFGTETCDTSKICKWWMVGRWMVPTALLFFAQTFLLLFQIIFKQKEPDDHSFFIYIKWKGTFSSKKEPIGKVCYIAEVV